LGQSVEHLVCAPKIKGWRTLLKIKSNPLQSIKNLTQNQGVQSKSGLVPLIEQKIKKNGGFLGEMGFGLVGDKMGNLGFWVAGGGWVRWRRAGGGVSVVGEVDAGGGLGLFGF
jgi:hypothetical protein